MDGRVNVVEGRLEHIEMVVDGLKVESAANRQDSLAMRRDIQELMRMMTAQHKHTEGNSDGSQGSVNGNQRDRCDEPEGEKGGERTTGQPKWWRRVELPTFEGADPLN